MGQRRSRRDVCVEPERGSRDRTRVISRSGERWRHYRRVAEALRLEGMQFLMLSGPYNKAATHQDALNEFSTRLNAILATEVDTYFTKVAVEKTSQDQSGDQSPPSERSVSRV